MCPASALLRLTGDTVIRSHLYFLKRLYARVQTLLSAALEPEYSPRAPAGPVAGLRESHLLELGAGEEVSEASSTLPFLVRIILSIESASQQLATS